MNQGEHYDAIVIGTGITGGWATRELCENGLKTLVLERGRMVRHIEDYPTMNMDPWDFPYSNELSSEDRKKYHKQLRINWAPKDDVKHFFVNDLEHPYKKTRRKEYLRGFGYQGGASHDDWSESVAEMRYGKDLKASLQNPGHWEIGATDFGEMLPYHDDRVTLSATEKDQWGLPQLDFDVEFKAGRFS
jgi:choline dehydrogenase-like flavoprotein